MNMSFGRELASITLKVLAVIFTFVFMLAMASAWFEESAISDGMCNVAVLPIEGVIMPYTGYDEYSLVTTPGQVRDFVANVNSDPNIKAVLFDINSPGGAPVAAEQISESILELEVPVVSVIGDVGASAAYLIAASADSVIASPMSTVGSIGVTMSYLENSKQNEEDGLTFVELASGKYKDSGNPNKPLTEEERAIFMQDIEITHDEFVKDIAILRNKSVEEIEKLADGSAVPGVKALELGLVDLLGGRDRAKRYLAEQLSIDKSEVVFCEYTAPLLPI